MKETVHLRLASFGEHGEQRTDARALLGKRKSNSGRGGIFGLIGNGLADLWVREQLHFFVAEFLEEFHAQIRKDAVSFAAAHWIVVEIELLVNQRAGLLMERLAAVDVELLVVQHRLVDGEHEEPSAERSPNGGEAGGGDLLEDRHHNEKIAILGGSGMGKTTLLKLLLGLAVPDSGRVLIDGEDISRMSPEKLRAARMKFSIVFQEGALFDSLNVKENIAFALREYTNYSEGQIDRRVRELAGRLGIEQALYLMPEELSGGMQRRVAIARSLAAGNPKMMLYDEPTTGLDPLTAANICILVNELSRGDPPDRMGLIAVTHKVTDVVKLAERFIYLTNGISFDGNVRELINTTDPELREFINELFVKESCTL